MVWPAPETATLTIRCPGTLALPVRPAEGLVDPVVLAPPSPAIAGPAVVIAQGLSERRTALDLASGAATYVTVGSGGLFGEGVISLEDIGTVLDHSLTRELTIAGADPLCASYVITQSYRLEREGRRILIETTTSMRASAATFFVEGSLQAFENGAPAAQKTWARTHHRDLI